MFRFQYVFKMQPWPIFCRKFFDILLCVLARFLRKCQRISAVLSMPCRLQPVLSRELFVQSLPGWTIQPH